MLLPSPPLIPSQSDCTPTFQSIIHLSSLFSSSIHAFLSFARACCMHARSSFSACFACASCLLRRALVRLARARCRGAAGVAHNTIHHLTSPSWWSSYTLSLSRLASWHARTSFGALFTHTSSLLCRALVCLARARCRDALGPTHCTMLHLISLAWWSVNTLSFPRHAPGACEGST